MAPSASSCFWAAPASVVLLRPFRQLAGSSFEMATFNEKLKYVTDAVADGNGESTLGSQQSRRHMSQTEFHAALDSEVTPPNQLR